MGAMTSGPVQHNIYRAAGHIYPKQEQAAIATCMPAHVTFSVEYSFTFKAYKALSVTGALQAPFQNSY